MTMNAGDPCRCCVKRQLVDIRKRNFTGSARESELPIVPIVFQGQHNFGRGKGQYLLLLKERRKGDCGNAINSKCSEISGGSYTGRPSEGESLWEKMIGEPYSRKATVRFDEGNWR